MVEVGKVSADRWLGAALSLASAGLFAWLAVRSQRRLEREAEEEREKKAAGGEQVNLWPLILYCVYLALYFAYNRWVRPWVESRVYPERWASHDVDAPEPFISTLRCVLLCKRCGTEYCKKNWNRDWPCARRELVRYSYKSRADPTGM